MPIESIHFVTGRLAEPALRNIIGQIAEKSEFHFTVDVLPITVAALMTPAWIAKHITVPPGTDRIVLPGYCSGDLTELEQLTDVPLEVGPKDLRQLPQFFGQSAIKDSFGDWDIDIIAEINHAPRLTIDQILSMADALKSDGATLIDVGCLPNSTWHGVGDCVKALKDAGHRVSIDSLDPVEIAAAAKNGAETSVTLVRLSPRSSGCRSIMFLFVSIPFSNRLGLVSRVVSNDTWTPEYDGRKRK